MVSKSHLWAALNTSVLGFIFYIVIGILITPAIQPTFASDPTVFYAPSYHMDARQYVYICNLGYNIPPEVLPTIGHSRISWMPVYPFLQCGLHHLTRISLVYAGTVVSAFAVGIALFLGTLTLVNLGVRYAPIQVWVVLTPVIGGAWLYLPGVEATYLAIGMMVLWLVTLPAPSDTEHGRVLELARAFGGILLGIVFILTKPNALALLLPLLFAFLYLSWQRSREVGYQLGLWPFVADTVIEHLRVAIHLAPESYRRIFELEKRPVRYNWTPLCVAAGILLGFAAWLAYTSLFSGVRFYFLQQQLDIWNPAWPGGNLGEMILYFSQAFRGIDGTKPWRYVAAWYLAANLTALIPAATRRVPPLIRGMLLTMSIFILFSGSVNGSDRYMLSTALVPIGWACWLTSTSTTARWSIARWLFTLVISALTFYLLVWQFFPRYEPKLWPIIFANG